MFRWFLSLGCALLMTGACGGSPSPGTASGEQGARDAAAAWFRAVSDGEAGAACALMTGSMRSKVIAAGHSTSCEAAIRTYGEILDEPARTAISNKSFTLEMRGRDYAEVGLNTTALADRFAVARYDGQWKLDNIIQ